MLCCIVGLGWCGIGWALIRRREKGCGQNDFSGGGSALEVGFRDRRDVRRWLGEWEGEIRSVVCSKI